MHCVLFPAGKPPLESTTMNNDYIDIPALLAEIEAEEEYTREVEDYLWD